MRRRKRVAERADKLLAAGDLERLFQPLKTFDHVVLAVSGGPDSIALLRLAASWNGGPKFSVLTVDHGLRPESARETAQVERWARAWGLEAQVLRLTGSKPRTAIQAAAREARYRRMAEWCAANGAQAIVTAHTLDDQAETLLMRLARGSGVDGLSAMPAQTLLYGMNVFRPLLDIPRSALKAHLDAIGQGYILDPSNGDSAFERVRVRKANGALRALGLTAKALALSAKRLGRARRALDEAAGALESYCVSYQPEGHAVIDRMAYFDAPEEMQVRVLMRVLAVAGGPVKAPQLAAVERAVAWMTAETGSSRTLGGCRITRRRAGFIVGRELGRMRTARVTIHPGETVLWDSRFAVHLAREAKNDMELLPLWKARPGAAIKRPAGLPDFVFQTLPALLSAGEIALVPQLSYCRPGFNGPQMAEVRPLFRCGESSFTVR
jgi:tRNA(Ile)-lysidine synthase